MEAFQCTFLTLFLLVWSRCLAENTKLVSWREVFTVDVVAPGASLSTAAVNERDCARHCLQLEDCKTSAFHQHSATCWLYRHLVEYSNNGTESPGTRYFWRLSPVCPGGLGYLEEAGICFRVYKTVKTWKEARETCKQNGGHLLIADTAEKVQAVLRKSNNHAWLGASDQESEGDWRWVDGSAMQSQLWSSKPDNYGGNEDFLEMTLPRGTFNDNAEGATMYPACQIPWRG